MLVREQFPQLKIFARARNRQHAFALMDAGVTAIIRETYASSLEMAGRVLETLGESRGAAREAVRRSATHDEATLAAQYQVKEDEDKFLATSREAAEQLQKLFEADQTTRRRQQWMKRRMDEARQVRDFWFGRLPLIGRRTRAPRALLVQRRCSAALQSAR